MTISPNTPSLANYLAEPAFWAGAITTLILLLITMGLGGFIAGQWNKVIQFRQPSKAVSLPGPGPSPAQRLWSCLGGAFLLIIVLGPLSCGAIWVLINWNQVVRPYLFGY